MNFYVTFFITFTSNFQHVKKVKLIYRNAILYLARVGESKKTDRSSAQWTIHDRDANVLLVKKQFIIVTERILARNSTNRDQDR